VGQGDDARLRLKCDGTREETIFRLSAKQTSPFKSAGASVQSTTGSRGVRISGSNAGYTMFRGSVKITGYPLHSPVSPSLPPPRALPCAITFQLDFTSALKILNSCPCSSCHLASTVVSRMSRRSQLSGYSMPRDRLPSATWPSSQTPHSVQFVNDISCWYTLQY
jgi:hypothetical protein